MENWNSANADLHYGGGAGTLPGSDKDPTWQQKMTAAASASLPDRLRRKTD